MNLAESSTLTPEYFRNYELNQAWKSIHYKISLNEISVGNYNYYGIVLYIALRLSEGEEMGKMC